MNKKDYAGEPYYLIETYRPDIGKCFRMFPFNAHIMKAHWEFVQWLRAKKLDRSQAV